MAKNAGILLVMVITAVARLPAEVTFTQPSVHALGQGKGRRPLVWCYDSHEIYTAFVPRVRVKQGVLAWYKLTRLFFSWRKKGSFIFHSKCCQRNHAFFQIFLQAPSDVSSSLAFASKRQEVRKAKNRKKEKRGRGIKERKRDMA